MRRPGLVGVLETVLYHESAEREAVECFYGDVLGLTAAARWKDGIAFRIGRGVMLLFDREQLALRAGPMGDHGTSGTGHARPRDQRHGTCLPASRWPRRP